MDSRRHASRRSTARLVLPSALLLGCLSGSPAGAGFGGNFDWQPYWNQKAALEQGRVHASRSKNDWKAMHQKGEDLDAAQRKRLEQWVAGKMKKQAPWLVVVFDEGDLSSSSTPKGTVVQGGRLYRLTETRYTYHRERRYIKSDNVKDVVDAIWEFMAVRPDGKREARILRNCATEAEAAAIVNNLLETDRKKRGMTRVSGGTPAASPSPGLFPNPKR